MNRIGTVPITVAATLLCAHAGQVIAQDQPARTWLAGISYGVIFDGSSIDKSDLQWTTHAIERFRAVTRSPDTLPDDFVFQTWHSYPTQFLPDSRPGTLTSVVVQTVGAH